MDAVEVAALCTASAAAAAAAAEMRGEASGPLARASHRPRRRRARPSPESPPALYAHAVVHTITVSVHCRYMMDEHDDKHTYWYLPRVSWMSAEENS